MKRINGEFNPEKVDEDLLRLSTYMMYSLQDDIDEISSILKKSLIINEETYTKFGRNGSHFGNLYRSLNEALVSLEIARKEQKEIIAQLIEEKDSQD
jgi:arabinogalactan endo-1,4-beta-galactosidase